MDTYIESLFEFNGRLFYTYTKEVIIKRVGILRKINDNKLALQII
jgi:hypothetical protein